MSDKPYSPLRALNRARRVMDSVSAKHTPQSERPLTLSSTTGPVPCAVLLRSLTDNGPVPDDFHGLDSGQKIKAHIRPDGSTFIGAYELQGDRDSVVLMYGPATLDVIAAEKFAMIERPALIARHEHFLLGPFAAPPSIAVMAKGTDS